MKRVLLTCIAAAALLATPAYAKTSQPIAEIQKFYADLQKTMNSTAFQKNPELAYPFFDENVRLFDVMLPEEFDGPDFREHFVEASLAFPGRTEFADMYIHANDQIAFVSYVQHFVGRQKDGPTFDIRTRATDGLIKSGGKWRIAHEHLSLPLDDATLRALMAHPASAP